MIHHIKRATLFFLFGLLIAVALGLAGLRLVLHGIEHYRIELSSLATEALGADVRIGRLAASMRGFKPELRLLAIAVTASDGGKPAAALKEIRLGVDLLDMALKQELLPALRVSLIGARLAVKRKQDGSFAVIGLKAGGGQPLWLFQLGRFEVLQSEVRVSDEQGKFAALSLTPVDLAITNSGEQHRIALKFKPPSHYGDELTMVADVAGDPFAPDTLAGRIYIDGKQLRPSDWGLSDMPVAVASGVGDVRLWADFRHSAWLSVDGAVKLQQLRLTQPERREFSADSLDAAFQWRRGAAGQWQLAVNRLLLAADNRPGLNSAFKLIVRQHDAPALPQIGLSIAQLDLHALSRLAEFFAPLAEADRALLAQLDLKGSLRRLSLFGDLQQRTWAVNGDLVGVGCAASATMPGVQNLSAHISGNEQQGVLSFATQDATVSSPGLFRDVLAIDALQGALRWRQQDDALRLTGDGLAIDAPGLSLSGRARVLLPNNRQAPFVDIDIALASDDAGQLRHYLPVGMLNPVDAQWLERAFVRGRIPQGRVSLYGRFDRLAALTLQPGADRTPTALPVADIAPGREGAHQIVAEELLGGGVFEALLDVSGLELIYAPDWPSITDIDGRLQFLQRRMEINAQQGRSGQLQASNARVVNEAIGRSNILTVNGDVEGQIADAFAFLRQTPLNAELGGVIDAIAPNGRTKIALAMAIPLDAAGTPDIDGSATLNNAGLTVSAIDLPVSRINGLLKFNEQGVYSDTIRAVALERPVLIDIDNTAGATQVNITGDADIKTIEQQFGFPASRIADGLMTYRAQLHLPDDTVGAKQGAAHQAELNVTSDLSGVKLTLPDRLAKNRMENRALALRFMLGDDRILPVAVDYDGPLKARLHIDIARHRIAAGRVLFGNGDVAWPTAAGVRLAVNRDRLDLGEMLGLAGGQGESGLTIAGIKLHADQARWGTTALGRFDLDLTPDGEHWQGRVDSALATGRVDIPYSRDAGVIRFELERLDLSALADLDGAGKPRGEQPEAALWPESVPLFAVASEQTFWHAFDLGRLQLQTARLPGGIALKQLELSGATQKLALSGAWKRNADYTETTLRGRLDTDDAGKLLARLGVTQDVIGAAGHAELSLYWRNAPHRAEWSALKGGVDLRFIDGRILSIEPGFGRILGVLAMEQWVRRLQLDFSDVFEQGLTFNTLTGHFLLQHGVASTQNLVVDAVPALITLAGDAKLADKTADLRVHVVPKGAEAVPIAGTIMGKVSSLITQTLAGESYNEFFLGSQYRIQGSWDALQVIPLHDRGGLLPKTWTNLTEFPWLTQP